ncbi:glycosyltransferase family 25 protein [Rothia terrae]|uniref:Glycosyltransferase family 25 protein n=1 Tax=Rothia terrae TaxID=396015 RepID=A0A7H2BCF1_9MICC|nr:glycosyltransferase family 25 protein [Rothia terrae]QNV37347.1 glycosyltransferase family 25 protein [Rothia terrae]
MNKIVSKKVISLSDSSRIETFFLQKDAQDFLIYSAVDGRSDIKTINKYFDKLGFENLWKYKIPNSHAACAISHYLIIRDFAQSEGDDSDLLLVAEDDAVFTPRFRDVLGRIEDEKKPIDLLILAEGYGEGEKPKYLGPLASEIALSWNSRKWIIRGKIFRAGEYWGTVYGAGLYLISRVAAKKYVKFVENQKKVRWPSDWYHYWADKSGIRKEILRPGVAQWKGESSLGHETSISLYDKKHKEDLSSLRNRLKFYSSSQLKNIKNSLKITLKSHDGKFL